MSALPRSLYDDVRTTLLEAGRKDLADRLRAYRPRKALTSGQAAELLGVSAPNTVNWRFPREDVEAVKACMDELAERNRTGDLTPPDLDDDAAEPPLL